jgi:hypothetical protein
MDDHVKIKGSEKETYDIAEANDVEESRSAPGLFNVFVGEEGGSLSHGFGELNQFLDCLHRMDLNGLRFPATDLIDFRDDAFLSSPLQTLPSSNQSSKLNLACSLACTFTCYYDYDYDYICLIA